MARLRREGRGPDWGFEVQLSVKRGDALAQVVPVAPQPVDPVLLRTQPGVDLLELGIELVAALREPGDLAEQAVEGRACAGVELLEQLQQLIVIRT
ncbi:hypothetical protein [Sabulicella rubraurantiaca]|uniref:hypothetical protein n=1 Tax=Sabulicella rubraurantiaca TaxID=2811429 RepID=UPI001A96E9C1|nr:hypothetical protein [Sabulicella rubraurantiaca]